MGMKPERSIFASSALLVLALASFAGPAPARTKTFEASAGHEVSLPFPSRRLRSARAYLSNGMTVYLLEDPELPLIQISALIRTGSIYDPAAQAGLAKITAAVLRNGGTDDQSPQEINEALESMAAHLEFGMNRESGTGSLSVQKKDFPKALAIFSRLLMRPDFRSEQLDLAKKQEIEAIRRSNDDPEEIAYREFRRALYAGNPRGWIPTLASDRENSTVRPHRLSPEILPAEPNFFRGLRGLQKRGDDRRTGKGVSGLGALDFLRFPFIPSPIPSDSRAVCYVPEGPSPGDDSPGAPFHPP